MKISAIDTQFASEKDIPWAPMGPDPKGGVDIRIFRVDSKSNRMAFMNRFHPGFVAMKHRHVGEVHAYTLKGRWHYFEYDWVAGPGDYIYERPGTIHTLEAFPDNQGFTDVFFVIEGGLDVYDDNNNLLLTVTLPMFEEMYRQGLDALGLPYPAAILRD
jgi:2,4'-dihydroxyacetophenone dioxygenase